MKTYLVILAIFCLYYCARPASSTNDTQSGNIPTYTAKQIEVDGSADSAVLDIVPSTDSQGEVIPLAQVSDKIGGLCHLDDRILLVDPKAHKIWVYDRAGEQITPWGSLGGKPGHFNHPTDIKGVGQQLYVLDAGNNRIQVFDTPSNFIASIGYQADHISAPDEYLPLWLFLRRGSSTWPTI